MIDTNKLIWLISILNSIFRKNRYFFGHMTLIKKRPKTCRGNTIDNKFLCKKKVKYRVSGKYVYNV